MEKIFDIDVSENIEAKFKENPKKLAPKIFNFDSLILYRLFHQTPDLSDRNNSK